MNIEQLEQKLVTLRKKVHEINSWIRTNPDTKDPNAYEIIDCNLEFAEIIAELKVYYVQTGEISADLDDSVSADYGMDPFSLKNDTGLSFDSPVFFMSKNKEKKILLKVYIS